MISLRRAIGEADRIQALEEAAIECYCAAVQTAEQYLVEVDAAEARETKSGLRMLHGTAERAADLEALKDTRNQLRSLLRDYQEKTHRRIADLRGDLDSAMSAMQNIADSMISQDSDHRNQLARELGRLKDLSRVKELAVVQTGLKTAVDGIERCVDQMQRENLFTIAQLSDEIRVLQDRVESVTKLATLDPATGLLNRVVIESRIESAASSGSNHPLCLVYLSISNFKSLCHHTGRDAVEKALTAMGGRLRSIFQPEAPIGRWSDDEILIAVLGEPSHTMTLSKQALQKSSGTYPVQVLGKLRSVSLTTSVIFLERRTNESGRQLLDRVAQLAGAPRPGI